MAKLYDFTGSPENPMVSFRTLALYDVGTKTLLDKKVDKVEGKDLVSSEDIAQITTNKSAIESINEQLGNLANNEALQNLQKEVTQIKSDVDDTISAKLSEMESQLNSILTTLNNWV